MIIKISNLQEGIHKLEFDEDVRELELGEPFVDNLIAKVELNKLHDQVILKVDLSVCAIFECDRCTKEYKSFLKNSFRMVYMLTGKLEPHDDLNVVYLSSDENNIVLDDDVRDYALLAIPMKKLCNEDCKGLCPTCGKDLNEGSCGCNNEKVSPVWLPLVKLKNKINNN